MISPSTRASFEHMLLRALDASLPAGRAADAEIESVPQLGDVRDERSVMLSVATFRCRLHVFLHYRPGPTVSQVFEPPDEAQGRNAPPLTDVLAEYGNMVCGAINRELGRAWRFAGMSTPSHLPGSALDHLALLHDQAQIHAAVSLDGNRLLGASLLIGAKAPFDFMLAEEEPAQTAGELEFF